MTAKRKDKKGRVLRTGESQRKGLQYLMGHSDAGVTMNVYTHASHDHAEQSMQKILQFQLPEKARKAG